jgi:tight adherence protein C
MTMEPGMLWNLVMAFACVLLPYLAADLLMNLPDRKAENGQMGSSVPAMYRKMGAVFTWFADRIRPDSWVLTENRSERIGKQLLLANWNIRPELVAGAQIALCLLGSGAMLVVMFLLGMPVGFTLAFAAASALCGWFYPPMKLAEVAEKRQKALIRSLPFAIDLIGSAMRAGLDFNAAIRYYLSIGMGGPLPVEFGAMVRQTELGKSRVEALQEMALRVQTDSFTSFVDAVTHGIEVGASIVETMKMQGEDMRRERFHLAERQAARAPSVMIFPTALFLLPAVFIMVGVPVYFQVVQSGM